jgi:tRNA pseudouridine55 synthase
LLIVCTGKKTKEISSLQGLEKTYTGIISLGKTTPSYDMETGFENEKDLTRINQANILDVRDTFLGSSLQTPPMYSAVKKNGKALYKYARKGLEIERKKREIIISSFEITKVQMPDVHFEIKCSAGTYIRVIAHELGQKLGCGAYLKSLRRTMIGEFNVDDAFEIKDFIEYANKFSEAA